MPEYRHDHVRLRSRDPDGTARVFEAMFGRGDAGRLTRDV
jgi:hypothetical protein